MENTNSGAMLAAIVLEELELECCDAIDLLRDLLDELNDPLVDAY